MSSETKETINLDPGDARRPLYYNKFEDRARNFCNAGIKDEFTHQELVAIVYDYLNVVYRGIWQADDRYMLHVEEIKKLQIELDCKEVWLNHSLSKIQSLKQEIKSSVC